MKKLETEFEHEINDIHEIFDPKQILEVKTGRNPSIHFGLFENLRSLTIVELTGRLSFY